MDKTILHNISYGMYVIGACDGNRPVGCIINTCIQVTSENPIIAVALNKNNYTFEVIERSKKFCLSIISEETSPSVITTFGFQSSRDNNKYETFDYEIKNGVPVLKGKFAGWLICDVVNIVKNETHHVIFARLSDTIKGENTHPMTYEYYHKVIKGKAPKNAPTYQSEETVADAGSEIKAGTVKQQYVCSICGYVHEGDIAEEPDDYVCPICKAAKSYFVPA